MWRSRKMGALRLFRWTTFFDPVAGTRQFGRLFSALRTKFSRMRARIQGFDDVYDKLPPQ